MGNLSKIKLSDFRLQNGKQLEEVKLTYQVFGLSLGSAPVVLVNHALTGNSNVSGAEGWWKTLVGPEQVIDTNSYTVVAFNIPGNGFDDNDFFENYKDFTTQDIALLFWKGLEYLNVNELYAAIGGSLGGGIVWEMTFLKPTSIRYVIPIATNWKATDWLIANVLVQDTILNNSANPIHDARLHAMLLYRTPQSLLAKFNLEKNDQQQNYKVESWLLHHGKKLEDRFGLLAYKLMNHLLKTIGQNKTQSDLITYAQQTNAKIHQIAINSDYFFTADENVKTHYILKEYTKNSNYHQINSIHGHDAFLIEYEQLEDILKPLFVTHNKN